MHATTFASSLDEKELKIVKAALYYAADPTYPDPGAYLKIVIAKLTGLLQEWDNVMSTPPNQTYLGVTALERSDQALAALNAALLEHKAGSQG